MIQTQHNWSICDFKRRNFKHNFSAYWHCDNMNKILEELRKILEGLKKLKDTTIIT